MRKPLTLPPPDGSTLVDLLQARAAELAGDRAYTFLADGQAEDGHLTYAGLDARARAIAALLQKSLRPGDRALLLYPSGLDFIAAFFGCLYAGVIAVPAYPPRSERMLPRLLSIVRDARPAAALTTTEGLARIELMAAQVPGFSALRWLATDQGLDGLEQEWVPPGLTPESIAFLQYTSGSTSTPKGVMVSQGNLLHNEEMIRQSFRQSEESVIVGWLPMYHDMGLIGNVLQPLYVGGTCVLMSPVAFLQKPLRWLEAISRYRATTSGGPNFSYELCVRKIAPGQREGLDLSSWEVAYNGAEPVRAASLAAFAEAYAPYGFRRQAFYPCYGLAEATLFVTGGTVGTGTRVLELDAAALEAHRVTPRPGGGRELVSCGHAWMDQEVRIVEPNSGRTAPAGAVGEIWLRGPSVAKGYWQRPEQTERDFGARLAGLPPGEAGGGPFLRTGDLGFFHEGEIYVTGRLKDLIILRGRNHYPQDLEETAERAHPALRPGCGAAFAVDVEDEERLVLVWELERNAAAGIAEVGEAVRRAVAEEHEVQLWELVLLRYGTVPKTTSGKIQRHAARAGYLEGKLDVVGRHGGAGQGMGEAAEAAPVPVAAEVPGGFAALASLGLRREVLLVLRPEERLPLLLSALQQEVARLARVPAASVDPRQPLTALGLDSLAAVELQHRVEEGLKVTVPLADLLEGMSLETLVRRLLAHPEGETARPLVRAAAGEEMPLSLGQKALWFLHRLAPESGAYHIAVPALVRPAVDTAALGRALRALAARHPALRTTFGDRDGEPFQRVRPDLEPELREVDALAWGLRELRREVEREAERPFDLAAGPLLRATLFHAQGGQDVILLAVHHLVADFWSLGVLSRELGLLYARETGAPAEDLSALSVGYADYVLWQRERLAGPEGERLWEFWKRSLEGPLDPLEMPIDRPRPPIQTYAGATQSLDLGPELSEGAGALARAGGATPFMTLLAVFQALLYRYTRQADLRVGSPTAGRSRPEFAPVVGYFAGPLVLRTRVDGGAGTAALVESVRRGALEAFAHQDYPFPLLVERLQPQADPSRSPLFQVMFVLDRAPLSQPPELAAFAVGRPGARLSLGGLTVESLGPAGRSSQFDLTLRVAELESGLFASLQYNTDLFDRATAERLLGHFRELLAGAVADPGRALDALPLMTETERAQVLEEWNRTARPEGGPDGCLHELFEAQADRDPDAPAVAFGGREMTYGELEAQANRLAHHLRRLGVGPEVPVGLSVERSLDMVVALLGVLKAGGAYVPLDPAYPADRLALMREDVGAGILLIGGGEAPAWAPQRVIRLGDDREKIAAASAERPRSGATPLHLAYVLYTSGSTGRPKGVQIAHGAVVNFLSSMSRRPGLAAGDVMLALTTLSFDIAGLELFLPLAMGARVVVASRDDAADPERLARLLRTSGATVCQATPATWRMLVDAGWSDGAGLRILCGGEALPPDLAGRLLATGAELWNLYGPTETTIWSAALKVESAERVIPVGPPIQETSFQVVDPGFEPLPVGIPGELWIGGAGVARGYRGRPDLTAERFVPDPLSGCPGARAYRTGDLVRWLPTGVLEFLGRIDHQVKVRGFRIELGEIEAALAALPAVRAAVAVAREARPGEAVLVAYVVPEDGSLDAAALRDALAQRLPEYMLPAAFVEMAELPLTPSGKVDRRALPAPDWKGEDFVAPRTPVEEVLSGIWADVLQAGRVGVHDNFFALGGHSLLATRLVSRVRDALGVDLPVRVLFEAPTVARFAAALAPAGPVSAEPEPALERVPREAPLPLSFAQERLWFLDQLEPGSPAYNMPGAVRLTGHVHAGALAAALDEIAARHETLRTTFRADASGPVQVIAPSGTLALPLLDLSGLPEAHREAEARRVLEQEAERSFDLARGPLARAALVRLGAEDQLFLVALHHIVSDGWSIGVLVRELAALSGAFAEGRPSPLPELPIQYGDFAVWQRRWLTSERLEPQLSWWRERLADAPAVVQLPSDRLRPATASGRGGAVPVALGEGLTAAVDELARRQGATPFMVLLAAFEALLARLTDQPDIPVGTPVAHRTRPEVESLIGLFVNTLVMRVSCAGEPSFRELLARAREAALGAFAHQDLPFEKLVEALQPERSLAHSPLFQVMLAFQNAAPGEAVLPGVALSPVEPEQRVTKFDLHLSIGETPEGLAGSLSYSRDLFDRTTVERLAGHWRNLLAGATAEPGLPLSELPILTSVEREQLAVWNSTAVAYPRDVCLHELVEAQVERTPDSPALTFEGETWTYRQLNTRANRLAHHLRGLGVGPEVRVGVCAERSFEMVVGLLAVLKAGGAYVPLDPSYPGERLAYMAADSGVPVLLTQERLLSGLPEHGARVVLLDAALPEGDASGDNPVRIAGPESLAYMIYTSGSTGRPKGAMNSHRGIVNRLLWMQDQYGLAADDRVLQKTPFSFDVSVWEFFWPLLTGACLVIARPGGHQDPAYLVETIASERVTTLHFVPSMLQAFVETPGVEGCTSLRRVMASGEALPWDLQQRYSARLRAALHNLYGPTEAAVDVTWWPCDPADRRGIVPIGWPVANTRIHLVDRGFRPVPVGVPGELLIGGVQVGRGYHGRPELTAERFVPDPFTEEPGARLYRTGDLARRLATGEVEYLGRLDFQVKIRGFRIELGEIEAALLAHPEVREAVVTVRRDRPDDPRLAAYWVARGMPPSAAELRAHLLGSLPDYMVPAAFVQLEALPLSPNGKVDRSRLPAPETLAGGEEAFVAPRGPIEELLAQIWAEVLGVGRVGAQDRFFDLGGHSLLGTQMISRVREAFDAEVPLRRLFERPALAAFAGAVEEALADRLAPKGPGTPAPIRPVPRDANLPLSFSQERLWFLDQLEPGSALYNIPLAARLSGRLDEGALAASLREIVHRHEVLRTTFGQQGGRPFQGIAPALDLPLPCLDLTVLPEVERETRAREWIAAEAARPFDLASGPLLRAHLLRLGIEEHLLFINLHHIVGDRWSVGVLLREIAALYPALREGGSPPLPELPVQYADFAVWQRDRLAGEALERELSWWRERLAGAPTLLELPTDRPRPALQSYRGQTLPMALSEELSAGLRDLGRREGVTLFMLLLAAFQALMSRYSGQRDLLVGSPIAGRTRAELEPLVGFFANTVVLRGDLSGDPDLRTLLQRVRETTLGAYAHQDLPFEKLVEELEPQRNLSHSPLFQVVFVLQNVPLAVPQLPDLAFEPLAVDSGTAKFDLTVSLEEAGTGGRIEGWIELNLDLFDPATVLRMGRHISALLAGMAAHPERRIADLDLLSAAERAQLIVGWNDTATAAPLERPIHELFADQAALRPDDVAVVWRDQVCTYRELDVHANRLANHLRRFGVGPEVPVGFFLDRSLDMVVATLAILKAGGFYVPLDPAYPAERISFMIEDAGAQVLLSREPLVRDLPASGARVVRLDEDAAAIAAESPEGPESGAGPDNLAYVMYTSGSTGRPKGVAIRHRGVVRLVCGADYADFGPDQVFLQLAPVSFDAATFEIWGALLNGGRLVVFPSARPSLEELGDVLEEHGVTTLWLTTGLFHQMVERHLDRLSGLRQLLAGGDVVSPVHAQRALSELPGCRLINGYGPTENTTFTTTFPMRSGEMVRVPLPIGRPIAHTSVHVLDEGLRPVPLGVQGELCIGGAGLARGYLGRPELTAERFVPDPVGGEPGERLYRTGDRVRQLPDGRIDFLGRFDHQVKLRGFRIELGEIESVLTEHPAVREAVILLREDLPGGRGLVAYVVTESPEAVTAAALREYLGARLPDYMVPGFCVLLPGLPLTANGKIDRAALPAPERDAAAARVAVRTPAEARLAELFAQVLELPGPPGAEADFFELGGHSLLATQLVSRVREAFGVDLSLRAVFETPTVEGLARLVEAGRPEGGAAELRRMPHDGPLPLSFTQERLWFLDQLEPGGATYTIPGAVRLTGVLDVEALRWCLTEVVRRHEVLRSTYGHAGGRLVQRIAPSSPIDLQATDLSHLPPDERRQEVESRIASESESGFDLATGPLVRAGLLRLGPEEHVLVIDMHHIVADGWSLGVLVREVSALYAARRRGEEAPLSEPPVQYADFTRWQRERMQGPVLEEHLAWWRERLGGEIPVLELPTDRPRPRVQTFRGADQTLRVDVPVAERLRALARGTGSTLFMTLLAAFKVLLHRQTGQEDLLVGSPVAGRDRSELEELIGPFINTLVLRTDLSGRPTFLELLARVREGALGAFNHRELPFEKLLEAVQPERDASRTPLFQVLFNMLNFPGDRIALPGLTLEYLRTPDLRSKFDMTIYAAEEGEEIHLRLVYNADLFDRARIGELLGQLEGLLAQIAEDPGERIDRYSLLTPSARRLLPDPSAVLEVPSFDSVARMFLARAASLADHPAVRSRDRVWSYAELRQQALGIAHALRERGVSPGDAVAVYGPRSPELIASLLGVFLAGGVLLNLDRRLPEGRLRTMVREAKARFLVGADPGGEPAWAGDESLSVVPAGGEPVALPRAEAELPEAGPDDPAYIFFTSGTTGVPKGVLGRQKGLSHFLAWQGEAFDIGPGDRAAQLTGLSFDVVLRDILVPLTRGATLCLPDSDDLSAEAIFPWLQRIGVTVLHTVPSLAGTWLSRLPEGTHLPELRWAFFAGEPLHDELVRRWRAALGGAAGIVNLYGPTETTLAKCFFLVPDPPVFGIQPVGSPLPQAQALVLGPGGGLCGIGEPGEIVVRTPFRSLGYVNAAEEDRQRFRRNPFRDDEDDRVYFSGDRGRYRLDGSLEILGRLDDQIKMRGMRVEPAEIKAVIGRQPEIAECAVIVREDVPGDLRLVAYVVPRPGATLDTGELRERLRDVLPDYMIPSAFVELAVLPLNANGKIDRRALPAPGSSRPNLKSVFQAPQSELERAIAAIWKEILHLDEVGLHDRFFDLGGHSLQLIQLQAKLEETLQARVPLPELFNHSTVGSLARYLGAGEDAEQAIRQVDDRMEHLEMGKARRKQRLEKRQRLGQ